MKAVEKEAIARYNQRGSHSLCHYSIIDNKIYRKTHGEHVGFKMFMDNILLSLARKVKLPDMEFIVNLGDWPLVTKKRADPPIPIFSWCGSDDTNDIVMPTYDITEATLETMGRVMLDMLSVQANTGPKWDNKTAQGFFRGRDSRQERLDLVKLSRKHPGILDAKLTNMFFFKHNKEEVGELVKHISFFDFFKYKYQISLDGTVAAYRLPYLLAGDAVVFKQDSPYYEYFYKDLIPHEHYIPIKRDISDVLDKIQWAKDNDEEARQIAKNAQKYVQDHLLADEIFCYHMVLFEEYSKLLVSKPHIYKEMERVDQPTSRNPCRCHHPDSNDVRRDEL
ncbi:protein O-glucosyltransferase 2-like isoform X2 [Lineus longissimus]